MAMRKRRIKKFEGRMLHDYEKGWASFTPDAGTVGEYYCEICGIKCDVKWGETGPRTWIGAMMNHDIERRKTEGKPQLNEPIEDAYDEFRCPCIGKTWHKMVAKLKDEQRNTASFSLEKILQGDIDNVLNYHLKIERKAAGKAIADRKADRVATKG